MSGGATAEPVRYGMVGGGPDAFIGEVHRMAARLDGHFRLVAGAFSSDPEKSRRQGAELGLDPERAYRSWAEMAAAEAARRTASGVAPGGSNGDGEGLDAPDPGMAGPMEAVVIVTPNHLHHPVAKAFLEAGFHVICDKPLTLTVEEAEELCRLAAIRKRVFCVTYNYTGYPMVKEARARVASGALGEIRKVIVEYSQGWLSTLLEAEGHKQAEWRADPERAGVSSALGDIGVHAHNLAEYVTGRRVTRIFADLGSVVPGRTLEDDANLLLRMEGDVRGLLVASQMSFGERNPLRLRVYGSDGALDWCQEHPNDLRILEADGSERILHTGGPGTTGASAAATRLPPGHPEGFVEAFANVYGGAAEAIRRARDAQAPGSGFGPAPGSGPGGGSGRGAAGAGTAGEGDPSHGEGGLDHPTVQDGARGVHFVHTAVRSAKEGRWVDAAYDPPA